MPLYLASYEVKGHDPGPEGLSLDSNTLYPTYRFEAQDSDEARKLALRHRGDLIHVSGVTFVDKPYEKSIILTEILEIKQIPLKVEKPKPEPWDRQDIPNLANFLEER